MKTVSDTYKELKEDLNSTYNIKVVVNDDTEYDMNDIMSLKTYLKLFDASEPSIGNACSAEVDLKVVESSASWGRMSKFEILFQLVSFDGETESEWISAGVFYTDTRSESAGGFLDLHGYDAMLTLEQTWMGRINEEDMPTTWPITAEEAITLAIGSQSIVELADDVELDDTVPFVGFDEEATIRQTLKDVAAGMGGNWFVDGDVLHFVPLKKDFSGGTAIVGLATAGIAVVGSEGSGEEDEAPHIYIGRDASTFHSTETIKNISGVEITAEDGTVASAGDDDGYVLKAEGNFSDSAVASLALSYLDGAEYRPFEVTGAELDPVCELGDLLIIQGKAYSAFTLDFTFGHGIFASASAPHEEEVDHEYQILDEPKRVLQKALKEVEMLKDLTDEELASLQQETSSSIQQTANSIRTEVSENYYLKESTDTLVAGVRSQIQQTSSSLEISITNARADADSKVNEIKQYVRYELIDGEGTVIVGTSDNPQDFRVSSTQLSACYNGEPTSYWDQNEQVTPKKLRIPEGGSLQIGSFLIQPRTSGNLSFMWVGS